MRFLNIVIFAFLIFAFSCDGRDRIHKSSQQVLTENKLIDSFSEHTEYIPEQYAEIETDTILSNGFRVKIKSYTDMKNSVVNIFKVDTITHKEYHRAVVNEIKVYKNDKLIFNQRLSQQFLNSLNTNFSISDRYINNVAVIDELTSLKNNQANIIISKCIPRSVNCPEFRLVIDNIGNYNLIQIENNART